MTDGVGNVFSSIVDPPEDWTGIKIEAPLYRVQGRTLETSFSVYLGRNHIYSLGISNGLEVDASLGSFHRVVLVSPKGTSSTILGVGIPARKRKRFNRATLNPIVSETLEV